MATTMQAQHYGDLARAAIDMVGQAVAAELEEIRTLADLLGQTETDR
jgi:hypothetical protein